MTCVQPVASTVIYKLYFLQKQPSNQFSFQSIMKPETIATWNITDMFEWSDKLSVSILWHETFEKQVSELNYYGHTEGVTQTEVVLAHGEGSSRIADWTIALMLALIGLGILEEFHLVVEFGSVLPLANSNGDGLQEKQKTRWVKRWNTVNKVVLLTQLPQGSRSVQGINSYQVYINNILWIFSTSHADIYSCSPANQVDSCFNRILLKQCSPYNEFEQVLLAMYLQDGIEFLDAKVHRSITYPSLGCRVSWHGCTAVTCICPCFVLS